MIQLTKENAIWLEDTYVKLLNKMQVQCERTGSDIPYFPYQGKYRDLMMPDGLSWWTNGFWPGMLWQMYHATGKIEYKDTAIKVEERMDETLHTFGRLNHDVGFMFLPTAVANYKATGNEESLRRGLHAANLLAGRYNPVGEFIRAWNESHWCDDVSGWMIIDCMLNIPLLYWASEETKDPRYAHIANRHANTAMHSIIRSDGSCNHIASFNSETGEFLGGVSGQGYDEKSSWSRGQSWAVYGFAIAYKYTKNMEYLNTAKACAHYCIANLSLSDWVSIVDFRSPKEPVKYDSNAAIIIACGLLEIAEHVPELEKELYMESALRMLRKTEEKFANWNVEEDGLIGGGSTMYHDDRLSNMSFIYGDYFFLEAILRLKDKGIFLW